MSSSAARAFFLIGTLGFSLIFLFLTIDTIRRVPEQINADNLTLQAIAGKPTDFDRNEGRCGIADIRQAIREANQIRIHSFALAIDVPAKLHLPQTFGSGFFRILRHPTHLVRGLSEVYGQLSR